jgi:predicted ribosome quality control (RQC) complex YloA/Tae2 family protein
MDWICLYASGRHLERLFKGCMLEKAYSLGPREYFFSFRRTKRGLRVVLDPKEPHAYACEKPDVPGAPAPFAMLLRKNFERGKLKRVRQPPGERVLFLDFDPGVLALELLPRTPNAVAVWDGFIMGSHAPVERPKGTFLPPGSAYKPPPGRGRKNFLALTEAELDAALGGAPESEEPGQALRKAFPHLPGWFCREFAFRAGKTQGSPWSAASGLLEELRSDREGGWLYAPHSLDEPGGAVRRKSDLVLSPFPLTAPSSGWNEHTWESFSEAVAAYTEALRRSGFLDSPAARALRKLRREEQRLERTLQKVREEKRQSLEAWKLRRWGELILINLSAPDVREGHLHVGDIYEDPPAPAAIPLDASKNLQENAKRYFRRAGRLERALPKIERRMRELERALDAARERRAHLEAHPEEISGHEEAKRAAPAEKAGRPQKKPSLRGIRTFRSSDGFALYVGKDARANERLTFRVARPHDLWLHAHGYGGSHVVVVNPHRGEPVPERSVKEAARLAAYFSKGRPNARLDVAVTERRHVRRARGSPAGQVLLKKFRTLRVQPKAGVEEEGKTRKK